MKQNQIPALDKLNYDHLENIFNVYQDENNMYYYNLLQTIAFPQDLPQNLFTTYTIADGDTWPYISYKTLQSPNLWWIILLANNIQNPLDDLVHGTILRIPIAAVVREILSQIGQQ